MWPFYHPFPWLKGERNGKKNAKLVDWDKDGLTEQQRKRTVTILIRSIYKKNREYRQQLSLTAQCSAHSRTAINLPPAAAPLKN